MKPRVEAADDTARLPLISVAQHGYRPEITALRVAAASAVGAVLAWALKAVVIAAAGGLDQSPLEGPLFFVGLILISLAFAAAGVAIAAGRGAFVRVLGALSGVVAGLALFMVVETATGTLVPDSAGWVQEEAGLWAASAITAVLLVTWLMRRQSDRPGRARACLTDRVRDSRQGDRHEP